MGRSDQDGSSEEDDEEEQLLDCELYLIRKMRLAFAASLRMLEAARDDMNHMSSRMDRLRNASWLCRKALAEKKKREESTAPAGGTADSGARFE